jgi:signal transduction histidine kinase
VLFMVIQEAVTNSIRHGLSKTISVFIRPGDSSRRVSIEILDDGTGPLQRRGKRGVGLSFLAALSEGSWSLKVREGGGARLVASLWC